MDGGKSQSSQEEDEAPQAQKQLKIGHQEQGKEVDAPSMPDAWLPAPMLHGEPLMEDASIRNLGDGEGAYVADALERALLLPTNMNELKGTRMQKVVLSMKRYLGIVRLLNPMIPLTLAPRFSLVMYLFQLAGRPGHL